jgi:hypothetical protein
MEPHAGVYLDHSSASSQIRRIVPEHVPDPPGLGERCPLVPYRAYSHSGSASPILR